jgi:hypothetical protein
MLASMSHAPFPTGFNPASARAERSVGQPGDLHFLQREIAE